MQEYSTRNEESYQNLTSARERAKELDEYVMDMDLLSKKRVANKIYWVQGKLRDYKA